MQFIFATLKMLQKCQKFTTHTLCCSYLLINLGTMQNILDFFVAIMTEIEQLWNFNYIYCFLLGVFMIFGYYFKLNQGCPTFSLSQATFEAQILVFI